MYLTACLQKNKKILILLSNLHQSLDVSSYKKHKTADDVGYAEKALIFPQGGLKAITATCYYTEDTGWTVIKSRDDTGDIISIGDKVVKEVVESTNTI